MKTATILFAAALFLRISILSAGNYEPAPVNNNGMVNAGVEALSPVTPAEATFEDITGSVVAFSDLSELAPIAPAEADFSDVVTGMNADMTSLVPVTPSEADFE